MIDDGLIRRLHTLLTEAGQRYIQAGNHIGQAENADGVEWDLLIADHNVDEVWRLIERERRINEGKEILAPLVSAICGLQR